MVIIPFDEKYLVDWIYDGEELPLTQGYDLKKLAVAYGQIGECYMGLDGEKLVGIGGVYPVLPGIGQAFLFLNKTPLIKNVFKAMKQGLAEAIRKTNYKKIQIYCIKNNPKITNLAIHLNFEKITDLSLYEYRGI